MLGGSNLQRGQRQVVGVAVDRVDVLRTTGEQARDAATGGRDGQDPRGLIDLEKAGLDVGVLEENAKNGQIGERAPKQAVSQGSWADRRSIGCEIGTAKCGAQMKGCLS
ncbi:hypothetical protein D3C86_1843870 [compost metagenome]